MPDSTKLHVKIGDAEFDGEGPQAIVDAQYDKFLAALAAKPPQGPKKTEKPGGNDGNGNDVRQANSNLPPEVLAAAFVERNGYITLKSLPSSENSAADSALAIMYGYKALKQQDDVTAVTLAESVRVSGITVDRLDRIMGMLSGYVRRGGVKRGTRYTLNNQGVIKAEEILVENYS